MNIIYAECNTRHNSIDIATTAGYLLRIDCCEAEKGVETTPGSECALNALAIDNPGTMYRHIIPLLLQSPLNLYGIPIA